MLLLFLLTLLFLRFLFVCAKSLVVDDVVSTEDPGREHADQMHQDVAVEPQIKGARVGSLREPEEVDGDSDTRDDGPDDVKLQPGGDLLLAVVNNEDVDGDDGVVEPDEDEHESAEDAEGGVCQRGGRAEGDADGSKDGEQGKVELAQAGALVEGIVGVGDLVADEGEGDEGEVEHGDVGVDDLVEAAERVEEDRGRHGAHGRDVDAEVPEVVDGPVVWEHGLEGVELDAQHHEEGDEVGPDVHGFVVILEGALDAVAEVVADPVPAGEEGLLHPVEVALVHSPDVPHCALGDGWVFDVVEHDPHDGPPGDAHEPEEDEEA